MMPINARAVYIKREAAEDARSMERIERMTSFISCETEPEVVDDAGLCRVLDEHGLLGMPRHGRGGDDIEPVVIFNQFLYHHTPEQRARRREAFPQLFTSWLEWYGGYGGWDWRRSGSAAYRRETGLVCQPAYAIHSFWGCHYRCAYCGLGHVANVYVNLEDWVEHIREGLANLENSPDQKLFQWDNGTDVACWEPEYGGTKMLVDLFAEQPDKHLELYVGKSENVDFMLDWDHRGHTLCCWSLGGETQCREIEKRSASMEARIAAARKCREAGYPIRIRLSPMIPVAGWEGEVRRMIRRLFEQCRPELITMEPLRFMTHEDLLSHFEPGLLDEQFVDAMAGIPDDAEDWQKRQFPDELRIRMYRVVLDEMAAVGAKAPVALCREKRRVWEALGDEFARMGQHPDDYVCNCGPVSVGDDPRLVAAR